MASLVFQAGPNAGRRYKLGDGDYIIGRRSDCQIFVPDMRVSRQHARIRRSLRGWAIEDLGSNNGTYLNGQRIRSSVLSDRDEIAIAKNRIRVDMSARHRAALALDPASQSQISLHRLRRLERDLRVARQIQRSLLPASPPAITNLTLAVQYEPANEVGGDFYDFVWHDRTHLGIVIGDVAGKAVSAALYMARLTSELRARSALVHTPSELLDRVNREMLTLGQDGMFATLAYAIYDLQRRTMAFTNAGHMMPLLYRCGAVSTIHDDGAHGLPIGVSGEHSYGEVEVQLMPGDLVLFTTDGVQEARDRTGAELGALGVARCLAPSAGGPQGIVERVLRAVDAHIDGADRADDITVLAMAVGVGGSRRQTTIDGPEEL